VDAWHQPRDGVQFAVSSENVTKNVEVRSFEFALTKLNKQFNYVFSKDPLGRRTALVRLNANRMFSRNETKLAQNRKKKGLQKGVGGEQHTS
jgi:hypothetical protein